MFSVFIDHPKSEPNRSSIPWYKSYHICPLLVVKSLQSIMASLMAPGCFSGVENEDFDKFLCKVELYCIALDLSVKEVEKCAVLGGLLEGVAYDKYAQLGTAVEKN